MTKWDKRAQPPKNVFILLPTYNEAGSIKAVIDSIQDTFSGLHHCTFTILVLDDHSPDGTAREVKKLQKQYSNISLSNDDKKGLGRAYLRGFRYALTRTEADVVIMMDADLSHDPADIPRLLTAIEKGADYVIGGRYMTTSKIDPGWPLPRVLLSRIANFVARRLVGIDQPISDLTGGFKAVRRSALQQLDLDELRVSGFVFQVSLLHTFLKAGFIVSEVPISFQKRLHGKSKLKLRDIVEFAYQVYKLNPDAPLQRFMRFALVGFSGALVNLLMLTILYKGIKLDPLLSSAIAIEVSIINNFFLNHFYTFRGYGAYSPRSEDHSHKGLFGKFLAFNVGVLGGAIINFGVFSVLFKLLHVDYLLAAILAILISLSWNYYISTRYVWKAIDQ